MRRPRRSAVPVAPFAGAWIETQAGCWNAPQWPAPSRPLRGGVDRNEAQIAEKWKLYRVAPFAGAWIETSRIADPVDSELVAPFAGAWIETRRGIG